MSPNHMFGAYDGDQSSFMQPPGFIPDGLAEIEDTFEAYYESVGESFQDTAFDGRSDYGRSSRSAFQRAACFTGAEGIKTADEALLYGGTADDQYDPCYHLAFDTFADVNLHALEVNADAVVYATLSYARAPSSSTATGARATSSPIRECPGPDPSRPLTRSSPHESAGSFGARVVGMRRDVMRSCV
jgi:Zn-dependent M28 family amino/carboxypeptidase